MHLILSRAARAALIYGEISSSALSLLWSPSRFLRNSANYMVTFARLAARRVRILYTNNLMERLMGEIARWVKNRWMHWSTRGLENLLNILLVRYCNRRLYDELKRSYLS